MIKVEMDGSVCKCRTDVSMFKGDDAVVDAAIEIKGALFSVMAQEFVQLVDQTGKSPKDIAEIMCEIIGCEPEEFGEFISTVLIDGNNKNEEG